MPRATWEEVTFGTGILPGQPVGLRAPGTVDLATRPVARNADGSISTVASMSIGTPDGEVLIPTIGQQGEVMTPQQAIEAYNASGYHLGIFDSPETADNYAQRLHDSQANEYVPDQAPNFLDTMAAASRMNNTGANVWELANADPVPALRPDYNPFVVGNELDGYEQYADRFISSGSPEETLQIKGRIDSELADRATIARAGTPGVVAAIAAGVVDPITLASMLVPIAGPEAWAAQVSRTARVLTGVATQVALDSAAEVAMHNNQELRTVGESLFNVGAGAFLTGAFGAMVTRVPKAEFERLREKAAKDLEALDLEVKPPTSSTAGAAQVGHATTLEDEGIAAGGATIAATLGRVISPLTRVLQSPVKSARVLVQRLADVPYVLGKNLRGVATPVGVEAVARTRFRRQFANVIMDLTNAYDEYRRTAPAQLLNFEDFKKAISTSMRTGDAHAISQVQDVARKFRKIFDADRAQLQALGVLPEELHIVGAKSYFPRVYNHFAIRKMRPQFEQLLRDWFRSNPVPTKVARAADEAGTAAEDIVMKPLDPAEVEDRVQQTIDNILGSTRGMANLGKGSANPRTLIARDLDVPDELLEPFLVSDMDAVMQSYLRGMAPQIEMRKVFGDVDLRAEMETIRDEYRVLISHANSAKLKGELEKRMSADLENIRGMLGRVMGHTHGNMGANEQLVRVGHIARGLNYVRMLGSQMLSSLSDYGHVMTRYGLTRTLKHTARFLTSSRLRKLSREDANRVGAATDLFFDTRAGTLADIGEEVPTAGRIDIGVHRMTAKFSKYSGMSAWNTMIKFLSMTLEQDAVVRAIKKGTSIPKFAKAKLAQNGIGDAQLERIAKEVENFQNDGGIWRMRTETWADQEMAKLIEQAIVRAGDIMTITRGVGDTPLIMNNDMAKLLFQFKSFGMASVNRIMIPVAQGIAHGDVASISGASMMLATGGLAYAAKEYAAGRQPNLSPDRLAMESLNWSGLLGYVPDLYDPFVAGVFGTPRFSKFSDQQPIETLMGPTMGLMADVYNVIKNDDNEWGITQKDVHAVRKLIPFQNLFYLRRIFNAVEGEVAENVFDASDATSQTFGQRVMQTDAAAETETPGLTAIATTLGLAALAVALGTGSARNLKALAAEARGEEKKVFEMGAVAAGATDPAMFKYYQEVSEPLFAKLEKHEGKLVHTPIAKLVKSLDQVVSQDSPYRPLVDKLLKADMPGNIYFGDSTAMSTVYRKHSNPSLRAGTARGVYDTEGFPQAGIEGTDHIMINMDMNIAEDLGHTVMHELTHAATIRKLQSSEWATFNEIIEVSDAARVQLGDHYAFTDTLEFVAEAFGNLEFQQAMKSLRGGAVWKQFIESIGKIFGIGGTGLVLLDNVISIPAQQDPPIT